MVDPAVQAISLRSNTKALLQFSIQYALLLVAAAVVAAPQGPVWLWLPALLIFSVMTVGMYAAAHETLHGTAFRSIILNDIVFWLATVSIFYSPTGHRYFHYAHHRFTRDPFRDPEVAMSGEPTANVVSYVAWLSGLPYLFYKFMILFAASFGRSEYVWQSLLYYVPRDRRRQLRWEARAILAFHTTLILVGLIWVPGLLLLFVGQWIGHALVSAFTAADHNGLPNEGGILDRTRTIEDCAPIRFILWNMPYHAEHHAYPGVPYHSLPKLRALLDEKVRHSTSGYVTFHRGVIRHLNEGRPFSS